MEERNCVITFLSLTYSNIHSHETHSHTKLVIKRGHTTPQHNQQKQSSKNCHYRRRKYFERKVNHTIHCKTRAHIKKTIALPSGQVWPERLGLVVKKKSAIIKASKPNTSFCFTLAWQKRTVVRCAHKDREQLELGQANQPTSQGASQPACQPGCCWVVKKIRKNVLITQLNAVPK